MSASNIEWTDYTWNPVTGCTKVSEGCQNCYAEKMMKRLVHLPGYQGGFENVALHPNKLEDPYHWKKSRRIFVCSMSDLFHPDVPESYIEKIWRVMKDNSQHIFFILTKRPERALKVIPKLRLANGSHFAELPNVWIGVSAENQARWDERTEILRKIKAYHSNRFVSCEPLIGPIRSRNISWLGWLIAGGESGHDGRPVHPNWIRKLRNNCKKYKVPFFFKQWGEWSPKFAEGASRDKQNYMTFYRTGKKKSGREIDGEIYEEIPVSIKEYLKGGDSCADRTRKI